MDNVAGATARLRRTFAYPEDDSSPGAADAMDEQEQEALIAALAAQNAARDTTFRNRLLLLPLLSALPYLPALWHRRTALPALLALTSLAATAWALRALPPAATGLPLLDRPPPRRRPRPPSPLRAWLPLLNLGLCAVLAAAAALAPPAPAWAGPLGLATLPALVYAGVLVAKVVMAGVDPERELGGLRYEYKGA